MDHSQKNTRMYIRWVLLRLAMVLFDIFAVNFAYFCALIIRFYVGTEFNAWAVKYIPAFQTFAPYYTVCSLAVFVMFRLYNSRWKYAGLVDLKRVLLACLATSVVQVAGSLLFVMRMPVTYYVIGGLIQFAMITMSRFSYRLIIAERDRFLKSRDKTAIRVMVVGVGETSRIVLKHMELDAENVARPVCLVDYRSGEFGDMVEGIPVISGIDRIPAALEKYAVENVILADSMMNANVKKQVRQLCAERGVEVQDFTGYFQDFRGALSLRTLLEYANGPVELLISGVCYSFSDAEQAMMSLSGKYVVSGISAKDDRLVVELQKDMLVPNDVKEEWARSYKEATGEDISFF